MSHFTHLKYNHLYRVYSVSVKGALYPVKDPSEIRGNAWLSSSESRPGQNCQLIFTDVNCLGVTDDVKLWSGGPEYRAGDKLLSPYSSECVGGGFAT